MNAAVAVAVSPLLVSFGVALCREITEEGIWKYRVRPDIRGEFGNQDPMGLVAGKHINTDCSIHWTDQDGRVYCFGTGTSLQYFLDKPNENARRAREFWMSGRKPSSPAPRAPP